MGNDGQYQYIQHQHQHGLPSSELEVICFLISAKKQHTNHKKPKTRKNNNFELHTHDRMYDCPRHTRPQPHTPHHHTHNTPNATKMEKKKKNEKNLFFPFFAW
jgi:hypothetical protein